MNKTSILIGALVALAFAHTAVGYGAQDCIPESDRLWVAPATASVTDETDHIYYLTGLDLSEVAGGLVDTVASGAGETVDQAVDTLPTGDPTDPPAPTNEVFIGVTFVTDTNVLGDCNGDGSPGDYDGDLDVGIGGFFFGSGLTWEALCGYGHTVHATSGTTADFLNLPYQVQVGIDDANGPTPPVYDPATGQEVQGCQTDGVISANPDGQLTAGGDCLFAYAGNGAYGPVCGGGVGGDDGYWGFVHCEVFVHSGQDASELAPTEDLDEIIDGLPGGDTLPGGADVSCGLAGTASAVFFSGS